MHDLRATARARLIRWRAKKREEARLARIAERDRKRIAKGLLPLAEAAKEKGRKYREKQARLREMIRTSWFSPPLTDTEFLDYATKQGWDAARARQRKESFEYAARVGGVNVNLFVLENYVHAAVTARLKFHEAWLIHQRIPAALEAAKTITVEFKGSTHVAQELDRQRRYADALDRWHEGDEIAAVILGLKYVAEPSVD
jgi:hypothetical protein